MNIADLPFQHIEQIVGAPRGSRWLDALLGNCRPHVEGRPCQRAGVGAGRNPTCLASDGELRAVVANRPDQLKAAGELVRRRYAWRGYRFAHAEESALASLGNANFPVTLLAEDGEKLLATVTVRADSAQGLQAEQTYGAEIGRLRSQGRRVGELVKLAVEQGADWKAALDALMRAVYLVTRSVHALTDVLIEVNPRHVRFYQRVFGFMVAGAERPCVRVGAPSVLMQLDIEQFSRRLRLSMA